MTTEQDHRLPRTVVPRRYDLTLEPDLEACTFTGVEHVTVDVAERVREVVLNATELEISEATLHREGTTITATVRLDAERERAHLVLDGEAEPGEWVLTARFTGVLNDKLAGFYRSTYRDAGGRERVIATTQMEATDARRAFPCWDEPDLKASFKVTLVVAGDLLAISNGAVESEEPLDDGRRRVTFTETMPMSTYLVAFIVGPLEATDARLVDGTPLRVVHVPGKEHLAGFALDVGEHALRFFADYFGIPYPGDKLDMIALPDFAFGAMENLGAVTYRETALLVDPETGSRLDHERVADVVSHELAHMWFGDLVTMKWWNGIWLNEAFATFMELLAVDAFRPEWERWVSFSTGRASAMSTDATAATRPIEFPVAAPEEAEGMFDVLTYQKGAAVVRMLEQYLGPEPFRGGIRRYMQEHMYGNTETTDLWDAIEAATSEPVRAMMDSWIFQGGHPLLSVELDGGEGDSAGVRLSQRRFRYRASENDAGELWHVPVMLRASVNGRVVDRKLIVTEEDAAVPLGGKPDWVVANSGGWGVYRVRYDGNLLRRLTGDLSGLTAIERFNLVNDTWAAVLAGLSPAADYVDLVRGFSGESDPSVWAAVLGPFDLFERIIGPEEDGAAALRAFVRELVTPALERVGWDRQAGEGEQTGTLRATLISALAGVGGDDDARARVAELHDRYLHDRGSVDPDLVGSLVAVTARTGGEAEYQQFLDRFRQPATPQEEARYLYGLGGFRHRGLIRRTLDLTLDEVRTQNAPYLVGSVLANPAAGEPAWAWVEEHWDRLLERFPDNSHSRMLESVSLLFQPAALAERVRSFLRDHPVRAGQRSVEQALEKQAVNQAFAEREGGDLGRLF